MWYISAPVKWNNIGSSNGLLTDPFRALLESIWAYYQLGLLQQILMKYQFKYTNRKMNVFKYGAFNVPIIFGYRFF